MTSPHGIQFNKARDFAERVISTFVEVELGLGLLDWLSSGINLSFWHVFYGSLGSALAATAKVLYFQWKNKDKHGSGAAVKTVEVK